jgi:Phospholipase_D-nuclease N-terminal
MTLALSALGWTVVVAVAIIAYFALLWLAFSRLFGRRDVGSGGKIAWAFVILFLPYVGALLYLLVDRARGD